jgi:hypothetical protein
MARVKKIDNADLKRFAYKKNKSKKQELRVYFLIVCEGEKTEPNYFKSFPKQVSKYIFNIQTDGGGINTIGVVEKAIDLRNNSLMEYDRVWAVFDKDNFKNFDAAIAKAKDNNIGCAWSNEAFELWYLLHFQYRNTAMSREDYEKAIEDEVNKKWKNKKKPYKYLKNAIDTYAILQKFGDQTQAIANAEKLSNLYADKKFANHNPRTQVYELVKQLIGKDTILNEDIKKKFSEI